MIYVQVALSVLNRYVDCVSLSSLIISYFFFAKRDCETGATPNLRTVARAQNCACKSALPARGQRAATNFAACRYPMEMALTYRLSASQLVGSKFGRSFENSVCSVDARSPPPPTQTDPLQIFASSKSNNRAHLHTHAPHKLPKKRFCFFSCSLLWYKQEHPTKKEQIIDTHRHQPIGNRRIKGESKVLPTSTPTYPPIVSCLLHWRVLHYSIDIQTIQRPHPSVCAHTIHVVFHSNQNDRDNDTMPATITK